MSNATETRPVFMADTIPAKLTRRYDAGEGRSIIVLNCPGAGILHNMCMGFDMMEATDELFKLNRRRFEKNLPQFKRV